MMRQRPDIPIINEGDNHYGTQIWLARVAGLQSHLRIIRDHLPECSNRDWLLNQINAGISEADRYADDAVPSDNPEQPS